MESLTKDIESSGQTYSQCRSEAFPESLVVVSAILSEEEFYNMLHSCDSTIKIQSKLMNDDIVELRTFRSSLS